jgi:hypothetical protein
MLQPPNRARDKQNLEHQFLNSTTPLRASYSIVVSGGVRHGSRGAPSGQGPTAPDRGLWPLGSRLEMSYLTEVVEVIQCSNGGIL